LYSVSCEGHYIEYRRSDKKRKSSFKMDTFLRLEEGHI
jgi:hypothetical protein